MLRYRKSQCKDRNTRDEKITPSQAICDCIIFQDDRKIALIGLKSSSLDPSKIVEQLTNRGEKSLSMIPTQERHKEVEMFFILLAKSYKNYSATKKLGQVHIKIHQKKYKIIRDKCGKSLKDLMI